MPMLFCDICNRSIPTNEIRFAEKRNNLVYCQQCRGLIDRPFPKQEIRLHWGRWVMFLIINLLWFLSIIVITEVCGTSLEVVSLSVLALLVYASSLMWLHRTLTK